MSKQSNRASSTTKQRNVDPAEIAKFEELASRWWDTEGEFKTLHEINPLRLGYIDARAAVANKRIIDVGCGGGVLSEGLAQRGADVTGIDMGDAPLSVARLHQHESELVIDYQKSTPEEAAEKFPESYDVVTCLEMLEHVPKPASVVQACATLTKPGGHLFFSTINRNPKSWLFAVMGAEYVLKLLPKGTHDFDKFIKPSELAQWIREADLQLEDITGMSYNPISKRYSLGQDVSVNYILHASKPNE